MSLGVKCCLQVRRNFSAYLNAWKMSCLNRPRNRLALIAVRSCKEIKIQSAVSAYNSCQESVKKPFERFLLNRKLGFK